jgi:drug/metabolite transporter (DMT)-like permease
MNRVVKAHLALLGVNVIYGANYSIAKSIIGHDIQPYALVLLRAAFSMILFWITSFFLPKEKIDRKDLIKLLLLGVFGVALNQLFFIKGLYESKPINASIIMILNPIFVIILEILFLREKLPPIRLAGIVSGTIGAALLLLFGKEISVHRGDIMILINCISWAIYLVMVKPLMIKYKTVTVVRWVFAFGALYVLPFGWPELQKFDVHAVSFNVWLCIAYVIVASTYFAYFLNTYALAELSPSIASTYIYLQPLIAAGIAISMGLDNIDTRKVLSAVFIIFGIYLVGLSRKKKKSEELAGQDAAR